MLGFQISILKRLVLGTVEGVRSAINGAIREVFGFLYFAGRRFYFDNCFQTASALTYTALLAMVPLMTIGFAIFSAFPAFSRLKNEVQDMLFNNLVPEVGLAVRDYLNSFMENAGQSTAFGVVGLALSAVLLLSTIEGAFGAIWRVSEPRPLLMRLLAFWALVTLAPLIFGASLSVSSAAFATFKSQNPDMQVAAAPFLAGFGPHLPAMFEFIGFSLVYIILPNRVVHWADAAVGGATAALLLEASKALFVWYVQSFPAYQTIYGAMSIIPIFLLWLYIAWSTILVGAVMAAALPEWRAGKMTRDGVSGLQAGPRVVIALSLLGELLEASRNGAGLRRRQLVDRVRVGSVVVESMLEQLREADWCARTTRDAWVLTRDLSEATLFDLYASLGIGVRGSARDVNGLDPVIRERCARLLDSAQASERDLLSVSLKLLLLTPGELPMDEPLLPVPFRAAGGLGR